MKSQGQIIFGYLKVIHLNLLLIVFIIEIIAVSSESGLEPENVVRSGGNGFLSLYPRSNNNRVSTMEQGPKSNSNLNQRQEYEVQIYPEQQQLSSYNYGSGNGNGWPEIYQADSTPEPIKYNYHIIPDEKEPEHHEHQPSYNHHNHHKGWSWGWHKEKKEKKKDGKDLIKSFFGIKALKIGSAIVIAKLFLLVFILAGISRVGTTLSPITLPFLSLPIAIGTALLFIPLLIAGFVLLVIIDAKKTDDDEEEGHDTHDGGWGHGWSRRKGFSRRPRNRRNVHFKQRFIHNRAMSILNKLPDLDLDHFKW